MTTNQTERVSDEELDQMIWKLERDGMTTKQLSLMRELREVRRENGEPVAWRSVYHEINGLLTGSKNVMARWERMGWDIQPLYTAPAAPPAYKKTENFTDYHAGWNACRAAMLNHSGDTADMVEPVSNRDELMPGIKPAPELDSVAKNAESLPGNSPATPDGWIPVSERMPDPKSELRVCVYTPNPHEDIRYRFVPASLFKAVCRDATHWHYMSAPKEVG